MAVPAGEAQAIYNRLLAGEPDATVDCIELFLVPLTRTLQAQFPNCPDLVHDVVVDSLLRFVQEPRRYDPARGSLWTYLRQDCRGDILNGLEKMASRTVPLDVELPLPDRNTDVEDEALHMIEPVELPPGVTQADVRRAVLATFPEPRDREILDLLAAGERNTEPYAAVLEITHLPIEEQRKLVKQHKDRINVRLHRLSRRLQGD